MSAPVRIVGCGPGAADLLTLRAARAIQEADVLLHDSLVTAEILALARPEARRIRVGRRAGEGGTDSAWVGRLLVREARAGARVVRLHGGDPSLFGRLAEETEILRRAGVVFDVVPGITAPLAAAASLQLPLTKRDVAASVLLTAGSNEEAVRTAAHGRGDTLVFYMAGRQSPAIARSLVAEGRDPATPARLVFGASLPQQQSLALDLATLARMDGSSIESVAASRPALLLVGEALARAAEAQGAVEQGAEEQGAEEQGAEEQGAVGHAPEVAFGG